MSAITLRPWKALLGDGLAPDDLNVERAIRGKVHGAVSDFRWIAATPGLDPQAHGLTSELLLGSEDVPAKAACWRALESGYCAVSCYPSRARDVSGRSGFLEKQVLAWHPGAEIPATLGALLLLPRVATFDDHDWWDQADDPCWSRPGFSLTLAAEPPVAVEDLEAVIERGRAALRKALRNVEDLARLYSTLLSPGRRLAFLPGLERPLPPEALAVLLLPLPREIADHRSIAGWNVSSRIDRELFPWDVLVCDQIPAALRSGREPEITEEGLQAAQDLLGGEDFDGPGLEPDPVPDPDASPSEDSGPPPRRTFDWVRKDDSASGRRTAPASAAFSEVIERLRAFAQAEGERWLEPGELAGGAPLHLMEDQAGTLAALVRSVEAEISRLNGPKREQLEVKADLLRAAALALAPSTVKQISLPKSERVPALLFCPRLAEEAWDRLRDLFGEARLEEATRQSLACAPDFFGKEIRDWLARWRPGW